MIREVVDAEAIRDLCGAWREIAQQERHKTDHDDDPLVVQTMLAIADTLDVATEELMQVIARIGYKIRTRDRGAGDTTEGADNE